MYCFDFETQQYEPHNQLNLLNIELYDWSLLDFC